ncbi:MAG: shikimate dehydrogenase [Rhizobiales bacterium]|nr:shikimate dehydrogenase [Hyphomicrobiales bacterium]NRB15198.1 shikimate dehydrogenase [Hyphomicrobiales bacterium]
MQQLYVIGWPIGHSKSPIIHNHWIKKYGLDANYAQKAIAPQDIAKFISGLTPQNCWGFNITIPHKQAVFANINNRQNLAKILGATNTISWQDNQLYASNTDGYGFNTNLSELSDWSAVDQPVIIYGAGGAARAILQSMQDAGAKHLYIYNRTTARAEKLLADLKIEANILNNKAELQACLATAGLFINTTSLGMNGETELDIDLSAMPKTGIVSDIVYTPLQTGLLKQAELQGLVSVDGLGMLLHQAAKAFEIWFGILPKVDQQLRDLVLNDS